MVSEFSKLPFHNFNVIGQILLQFSQFLSVVEEPDRRLAEVVSLINTDGSLPALKTLPGKAFPRPFLTWPEDLGSRLVLHSTITPEGRSCLPLVPVRVDQGM